MHFENASNGPGATRRSKRGKKHRKRGSLTVAANNLLAAIAKEKREPTPFERARIDSALKTGLAELKMKIARLK
jgi:hypothetical protein